MTMTTIIAIISSFISGTLGWMLSRKKNNAEVKKIYAEIEDSELKNIERAVAIWRNIAEDLSVQVKNLSAKCTQLSAEIETMQRQNKQLKIEIKKLEQSIENNLNKA